MGNLKSISVCGGVLFGRSRHFWVLPFWFVSAFGLYGQQSSRTTPDSVKREVIGARKIYADPKNEVPRGIEFNKGAVRSSDFITSLTQQLGIDSGSALHKVGSKTDDLGMTHHHFQQTYKGVPVEGFEYRLHERSGHMVSANGRLAPSLNLDIQPTISEQQAFQSAKDKLKAGSTPFKPGQLLITSKDFTFEPESFLLAYQFEIDISPIEKWNVSIDAHSGELINKVSLIHACNGGDPGPYTTGTGLTNYNGSKEIRTEFVDGTYRLRGQTDDRVLFETYDLQGSEFWIPIDVTDPDNDFTDENAKAGVSVHWGVEQSLNYFKQKHDRNGMSGYGGTLRSYVHYRSEVSNAYWNGSEFLFGDGVGNSNPWVGLDIVGHEFTHGVIQNESGVQNWGEVGALQESFSDIFGRAIELYADGQAATWTVGESVKEGGLRNLGDPSKTGQPDTYHGSFWERDEGNQQAIHINSGVQNFWFYLLCNGGSGINDHGQAYSVDSIGIEKATAIAYRNMSVYFGYYSHMRDSRFGSLAAAADLYGSGSSVYQAVENAWEAVGVSEKLKPIFWDLKAININGGSAVLQVKLPQNFPLSSYHFEYGTTTAYGNNAYINSHSYGSSYVMPSSFISGLNPNTHYYFRFVASNLNGTSEGSSDFTTGHGVPKAEIKNHDNVTARTATIRGNLFVHGIPTSYYFQYGTTPDFGSVTYTSVQYPFYFYNGPQEVYAYLYDLTPYQNYYYRLIAFNQFGSDTTATFSFFSAAKPIIHSLSATRATVGSEILINGNHFNSEPSRNIVHFGAARATVRSSSENHLTVTVPVGASLGSITYTNEDAGLSTVSHQEFVPIVNIVFSAQNLELRDTFDGGPDPLRSHIHDIDGDLKPDIINLYQGGFSVLQNVHAGGALAGASFLKTDYSVSNGTVALDIAEMNGDGRKDIVVNTQNGFRIYPNLSTVGQILFGAPLDVDLSKITGQIACGDFNIDGRMDVAVEFLGDSISFFKNLNTKGTFLSSNFSIMGSFPIDSPGDDLTCEDVNNDGRPDLIMGLRDQGKFMVVENYTYSPDFFSFGYRLIENSILGSGPSNFSVHDLNQDGYKEVAATPNGQDGNLTVYQGNNFYSPFGILPEGTSKRIVRIADINGEGMPDLVVGTSSGKFSVLLNNVAPYSYLNGGSFQLINEYGTDGTEPGRGLAANDLNGDGKTDLVNITGNGNSIEIWENTAPDGPPCTTPTDLAAISITESSAVIFWAASDQATQYQLEFQEAGSIYWSFYSVVATTQQIYLSPGKQYLARAKSICGNFQSDFDSISFSTPCPAPISLYAYYVTRTEASIGWNYSNYYYYYGNYKLEYRLLEKDWMPANGSYLNNLVPGQTYDVRMQTICTSGASEFTYSSFTTTCPLQPGISIRSITPTGARVELRQTHEGVDYLVEYSHNGTDWVEVDAGFVLSGLSIGTGYTVRAKANCVDSEFSSVSFTTSCPAPTAVSVNSILPTSAIVHWKDDHNIGNYSIEYTEYGTLNWFSSETASKSRSVTDLLPETTYKVRVHTICADRISNRTPILFTTPPEKPKIEGLILSPNPVQKELLIQSEQSLEGREVIICDIMGKVVYRSVLEGTSILDLSALVPGNFIVKIENEKPIRLIKE
jgi:Zn-dependent metalloprotease